MVDIDIMKKNKERLGAKKFYNNKTFAELMEFSKFDAFEYAVDCGIETEVDGMPAKDYVAKIKAEREQEEKGEEEVVVKKEEVKEIKEVKSGPSKEDYQELLTNAGIKFNPLLGIKKLEILAKDNALIQ